MNSCAELSRTRLGQREVESLLRCSSLNKTTGVETLTGKFFFYVSVPFCDTQMCGMLPLRQLARDRQRHFRVKNFIKLKHEAFISCGFQCTVERCI